MSHVGELEYAVHYQESRFLAITMTETNVKISIFASMNQDCEVNKRFGKNAKSLDQIELFSSKQKIDFQRNLILQLLSKPNEN